MTKKYKYGYAADPHWRNRCKDYIPTYEPEPQPEPIKEVKVKKEEKRKGRDTIIYEIVGRDGQTRKVGSSIQGVKRAQEQLAEYEYYVVLQTIPPWTLTVRECWDIECEYQVLRGLVPESEVQFRIVERARAHLSR